MDKIIAKMNAFLAKRDSGGIWTEEETTTFIRLIKKKLLF